PPSSPHQARHRVDGRRVGDLHRRPAGVTGGSATAAAGCDPRWRRGVLRVLMRSGARAILRLAVPALGALAAEPLYVLVDTAIVGHLGRPQLAALGLAGIVLSGAFTIFNFLTYGTTAVVARASGAGEQERAARLAAQALW